MKILTTMAFLLLAYQTQATPTAEQPDRNIEAYNLESSMGLKDYDPVSYFAEHGATANKGNANITVTYGGVTYRFSSTQNRDIFLDNPTKYEPTYGGWCAWAMANEAYADIDPVLYTQNGNRMHFFISRGAKARFDQNLNTHESNADEFWADETGEKPRK